MKVKEILFFNSLIYATLNQIGFLGFGIDTQIYINHPDMYSSQTKEFFGGYISALRLNNTFVAPFFVGLIIALGLGSLLIKLNEVFKKNNKNYAFHTILIHILFLLSWPIFVGATNTYRQGIALGFIFFLFSFLLDEKKNLWLILLTSFFVIFSHKFGQFSILIIYFSYFLNYHFSKFNISNRVTILFSLICIFIFYFILDYFALVEYETNYITGVNLLNFFYFIFTFTFVMIFLFEIKNYNLNFILLFFVNMFVLSTLFFFNNSLVYERINWLTFIISIFLISFYFSNFLKININLIIVIILLLLMTLTLKLHLPENYINYEKYKRDGLIK
jgi:hypothetical protein